jgi:hypothetical protein
VTRRFADGWTVLSSGPEPDVGARNSDAVQHYLFQRTG